MYLFYLFLLSACTHALTHASACLSHHTCLRGGGGVRRQLAGTGSFLLPCGSQELDSGCQACLTPTAFTPLAQELSLQPGAPSLMQPERGPCPLSCGSPSATWPCCNNSGGLCAATTGTHLHGLEPGGPEGTSGQGPCTSYSDRARWPHWRKAEGRRTRPGHS